VPDDPDVVEELVEVEEPAVPAELLEPVELLEPDEEDVDEELPDWLEVPLVPVVVELDVVALLRAACSC
jgi:hypothetical protein